MQTVSTALIRRAAEGLYRAPVVPRVFADRISVEMLEWATSHGMLETPRERLRASAIRVGELAALTFARHEEAVVRLGADLILWLYLFDDAIGEAGPDVDFAEHRAQLASFEQLLRSDDRGGPDPFRRALADIRDRATLLRAGPDWHRRFADDMADYFAGCADEAIYRRAHATPNLEVYRTLRGQTVGTSAVFAIAELGQGPAPSASEMNRRDVAEARRIAAQLTAWVNDLYSYPKEVAQRDPMNLVAAISGARGLTPVDAVHAAVEAYNRDLDRLQACSAAIQTSSPSAGLQQYMGDLIAWVHGNRAWTHQCGRYQ